jgi:hypothetical protein
VQLSGRIAEDGKATQDKPDYNVHDTDEGQPRTGKREQQIEPGGFRVPDGEDNHSYGQN